MMNVMAHRLLEGFWLVVYPAVRLPVGALESANVASKHPAQNRRHGQVHGNLAANLRTAAHLAWRDLAAQACSLPQPQQTDMQQALAA